MIEVSHLTRRFGAHLAVDDVSFSMEAGAVCGLLGPNGAGKTTVMRMLTGYLPATRGSVRVEGFDVLRQSMEVRRRIGYLPENVPLYPEHRVEEMLRFQGRLHGLSRGEIKRRSGEVLEQVGLTERRRSTVGALSRGLRQRAGLAVALLPRPKVLVLDEPTSGLDPIQRIEVRKLVEQLASERTVLLSSHILAEVEAVCPRVVILNRGRVAAQGSLGELEGQLGGERFVRFEAVVGDSEAAQSQLSALPGVERVELGEKVGIHQGFRLFGPGDLREDVGALAMMRQWAVRELSYQAPSLERIFASIALGESVELAPGDAARGQETAGAEPTAAGSGDETPGATLQLEVNAPDGAAGAADTKPSTRTLNPFENFGGGA